MKDSMSLRGAMFPSRIHLVPHPRGGQQHVLEFFWDVFRDLLLEALDLGGYRSFLLGLPFFPRFLKRVPSWGLRKKPVTGWNLKNGVLSRVD